MTSEQKRHLSLIAAQYFNEYPSELETRRSTRIVFRDWAKTFRKTLRATSLRTIAEHLINYPPNHRFL